MSDSKQILNKGLGSPFVKILDMNGDELLFVSTDRDGNNTPHKLSSYVTKFSYKYDEENDDECTIDLHFDSLNTAKGAYIKRDTVLEVRWGYHLPNKELIMGPKRMIAVRNLTYKYSHTKIGCVLECTDLFSYARNYKLNIVGDRDYFEEWLAEILDGKFIATIQTDKYLSVLSERGLKIDVISKDKLALLPSVYTKDNSLLAMREEGTTVHGWSNALPAAVEDMIQKAKGGPYYMEGRDKQVNIFKRNFNRVPESDFTFQGKHGELKSFVSKTNLKTEKLDEANITNVDKKDKKITTVSKNFVKTVDDKGIILTKEELNRAVKIARDAYEYNLKHPKNQLTFKGMTVIRYEKRTTDRSKFRGASGSPEIVTYDNPNYLATEQFKIPTKEIMKTPGFKTAYGEATMDNYILKKLERQFSAKAEVIGSPDITCGKVYNFLNLLPHEAGAWYCNKVTHTLSVSGGYMTSMELLRKPEDLGIVRKEILRKVKMGDKEVIVDSSGNIVKTDIEDTIGEESLIYNANEWKDREFDKLVSTGKVTDFDKTLKTVDSSYQVALDNLLDRVLSDHKSSDTTLKGNYGKWRDSTTITEKGSIITPIHTNVKDFLD